MILSEVKSALNSIEQVVFELPNGTVVPEHFHVTEVGLITRNFIDCGGTMRNGQSVNFQLWQAGDYDHRLSAQKLNDIILLSERKLGLSDQLEVEVEYQGETIGKYGLSFTNGKFLLTLTQTDCLAKDNCGIPEAKQAGKPKLKLSDMTSSSANACAPGGGCC